MTKASRRAFAARPAVAIGTAVAIAAVVAVAAWLLWGPDGPDEDLPRVAPVPAQASEATVPAATVPSTSAAVTLLPTSTTAVVVAALPVGGTSADEPVEVRPEQYRVQLGPHDEPGALWTMGTPRHQSSGIEERVLDMCVRGDAVSVVLGRAAEPDQPLTLNEQAQLQQTQWLAGCSLAEPHPDRSSRYVGWDQRRAALSYHATHEDAAAELRAEQEERRARRNTLPPYARLLGNVTVGTGTTLNRAIEYSEASSPLDEVQLIASSVNVADGVLRGMVRNRSRTLFAYGTTVTAGETSWRWPLSIQPGELAPFEIEDWTGPTDPQAIEIDVAAEMSPDVDRSRAFNFFHFFEQAPYLYPPAVEAELESGDCIAPDGKGRHYAAALDYARYRRAADPGLDSNPSLIAHIKNLEIADFRAYAAFYDERTYRMHDVRRLHVLFGVLLDHMDFDDPDAAEFRIIDSLPQPDPDPSETSIKYEAHMAFCNDSYIIGRGHTVWVGGAHSQHRAP